MGSLDGILSSLAAQQQAAFNNVFMTQCTTVSGNGDAITFGNDNAREMSLVEELQAATDKWLED